MRLSVDDIDGDRTTHREVFNPSWDDVEDAIRQLDGHKHTELTLGDADYIFVGGGRDKFFVFIWTADERNLILTHSARYDDKVSLVSGWQTIKIPSAQAVDEGEVLQALKYYYRKRAPDPTMAWTED